MENVSKWKQRARELEAEAKALRREEQEFWRTVDEMRDEVIEHLGVGQIDADMSDKHRAEIGALVEECCGAIDDMSALRSYLETYSQAIARTQSRREAADYAQAY